MTALRKILVVDDDPVIGKSFNRVLDGKGYAVVTASDGPEALRRLAEGEYDLVVADIRMPGMDGIEVAERVKARRPWTPVVIVTGYGTDDNETRARAAGAAGFLRKPLSPDMIEDSARLAHAPRAVACAPVIAAAVEPLEMPATPEPRRGLTGVLETAAMAVAAPLVALAFIIAAPVAGLAMLAGMAMAAVGRTVLGAPLKALAAPFIGLAFVVVAPFAGLAALVWMGVRALAARGSFGRVARGAARHARNVVLFFAAPFIGLAYALAFPFIGLYLLVRSTRTGKPAK